MTKLQKYFRLYNKKYFDDALPEPVLRWAEMKDFGHYYSEIVDDQERHIIEFGKWSAANNSIWRFTLLHELVHLKLRNKKCTHHGRLFQKEMKRLAANGAFAKLW